MAQPDVDLADVQSLFAGMGPRWSWACYFHCRYESRVAGKRLLQYLQPKITSCAALAARPEYSVNAALSFAGMEALELNVDTLASFPAEFIQGMRRRAGLNNDVKESQPEAWDPEWREHSPPVHLVVSVYAQSEPLRADWCANFTAFVGNHADMHILAMQPVRRFLYDPDHPIHIDDPESNPKRAVILEHFGFRDGLSNPAIAGLSDTNPAGSGRLLKDGSWLPLAAGEFLLGYADGDGEFPPAPKPDALARNGSYLVYRKLEQNVDLFRDYLTSLSAHTGVSADELACRMVGRRRDGTPLIDPDTENEFLYSGDPDGHRCPLGAHIRRANPRDTMGQQFQTLLVNRHRILRRGITYGNLVEHGKRQREVNPDGGQGLIFLALNTDISRQFEFINQQWLNHGNDLNQGNDRDPLCGLQLDGGKMVIPGDGDRPTVVCTDLKQFVRTRGGEYFFMPGIAAFNGLADEQRW